SNRFPPSSPSENQGIVQNPLPNHPPAQVQQPVPPVQEQAPPPAAVPPVPQENVQRINTVIPVGPKRVVVREQTWSIDGEPDIPVSKSMRFPHDLTVPPIIYMLEPEPKPQTYQSDHVLVSAVPQILAPPPCNILGPPLQPSMAATTSPPVLISTVQPQT